MAEWSKAADLSSVIFGCVGSNPTSGKSLYSHAIVLYRTLWRNWIARWTSNPTVAGSNPVKVVTIIIT